MSRARPAAWLAILLALSVAGCVVHPSLKDMGGPRIRPENGRAVRGGEGAAFYADIKSTGEFGDVLLAASSPIARRAILVDAAGAPVARLDVPGAATVPLHPAGPHVVLADLTRALAPGESIIVTLQFQKSGNIGVVTVVE
jgi:copper(I)-binding protein